MRYKGLTIQKTKNYNTYYTRIRVGGKQVYLSAKTQKELKEKILEQVEYKNKLLNQKSSLKTFNEWYEEWLVLFKIDKVKKVTLDDYTKTLKNISNQFRETQLLKITPLMVVNELKSITKERTKQKAYELLSAIFEKAKLYDVIEKNIFDIIEKPKHQREKGVALNIEEQEKFISNCLINKQYGDLFLTILFEGLRIGEALALTGDDIDFEKKYININKAINRANELDSVKTRSSLRNVPLFDKTVEVLENYKNFKENRIFNFSYTAVCKNLKKIIKKSNLPDFSIHDLRHTFITNCKNINIPEHIIQTWVGHEIGSKVTSQVYTHTTNDVNLVYFNKLNDYNSTHTLLRE